MDEMLTAPDPERVRLLKEARDDAYLASQEADRVLREADQALLEERCRDLPRHDAGDVILVKKVYFGKPKWVEARVLAVHLYYSSGTYNSGEPWEAKHVSYSVVLRQKDGEFASSSEGFYHHETMLPAGKDA